MFYELDSLISTLIWVKFCGHFLGTYMYLTDYIFPKKKKNHIQEMENGRLTSKKINVAALRPIPHTRRHKMIPFSGYSEIGRFDGDHTKGSLPMPPKHGASGGTPVTHRKAFSGSYQRKQIISLNPLPLKKHECGRAHIQICSEVCTIFPVIVRF